MKQWPAILILAAGCASKPLYLTPLPESQFDHAAIERIHAMLVKETRHGDLFTGETKDTVSRKSFFRRLAEKKGSPAIDYEEVLIARRP